MLGWHTCLRSPVDLSSNNQYTLMTYLPIYYLNLKVNNLLTNFIINSMINYNLLVTNYNLF